MRIFYLLCPIIFFYNQIKMKKVLFVFSIMLLPITAMALDCNQYTSDTTCPAGCTYSEPAGCTTCSAGKYGLGGKNACQQCPKSHPESEEGSTSQNSCYTTCGNKSDFKDGTWTPDNTKPNYPNACSWTNTNNITCDTDENNPCNGFHVTGTGETAKCITNKEECTGANGKGYRIYPSKTCYITECDQGYHLENTETTSCGDTYGTCTPNVQECNEILTGCEDRNSLITGKAYYVHGGQTNPWNVTQCKCIHRNISITNGKCNKECPVKVNAPNATEWYDDENCKIDVISCDIGYCLKPNDTNANSCAPAPRGYYHSSSDTKDCQSCPAGSTSNGTTTTDDKTTLASSKSDCHIVRGDEGTVFCDGDGCFTLPGKGNISWTGKQP